MVPKASDDWEDASPNASAMIESMRAHGYTLAMAIADLIDNSISAESRNVWIRFHWAGRDSWISMTDDGRGMDEAELSKAMHLGSRNPLHERDPSDLGRFGLGLKTASFSQCRRLTVASRRKSGQSAIRQWDLDYLAESAEGGWRLKKAAQAGSESLLRLPGSNAGGTVVLWEKIDRLVGDSEIGDTRAHDHFLKLVETTERQLSMVFHRYLADSRFGLKIFVNGESQENAIKPWDPFVEAHAATQTTPEESISLPGHAEAIVVRGYVLPHKDKLGDQGHREAAGPAGWNAQQGFYLYRNRRLIVAGSWLGLGLNRGWTQEEHYKLARIRIDIPNSMDHLWQLDVKKSSAQPPSQVRDRLIGLAQTVRQDARKVFAHRGRYGPRRSREELRRPWKSSSKDGALCYRIDRGHALISAVLETCSPALKEQIEAVFRVIEETLPVQQIWLDASEKPEAVAGPFYGMASSKFSHLIDIYYRTLVVSGHAHDEAIEMLKSSEEFASDEAQAIIQAIKERPRK